MIGICSQLISLAFWTKQLRQRMSIDRLDDGSTDKISTDEELESETGNDSDYK